MKLQGDLKVCCPDYRKTITKMDNRCNHILNLAQSVVEAKKHDEIMARGGAICPSIRPNGLCWR